MSYTSVSFAISEGAIREAPYPVRTGPFPEPIPVAEFLKVDFK